MTNRKLVKNSFRFLHGFAGCGGGGNDGDESSEWEEVSEEDTDPDALSVHGLPLGQDLLEVAAAAVAADDDDGGDPSRVCH